MRCQIDDTRSTFERSFLPVAVERSWPGKLSIYNKSSARVRRRSQDLSFALGH